MNTLTTNITKIIIEKNQDCIDFAIRTCTSITELFIDICIKRHNPVDCALMICKLTDETTYNILNEKIIRLMIDNNRQVNYKSYYFEVLDNITSSSCLFHNCSLCEEYMDEVDYDNHNCDSCENVVCDICTQEINMWCDSCIDKFTCNECLKERPKRSLKLKTCYLCHK